MKKLDTEITQNIMLGRGVQASSAAIAKDFNTTVNRAATLVYTETAHAASMAQKAGFEELGVKEFEIVATLDDATSEICQEMDGKHLPMSEFKAGVTAPPFHPNCRSVTAPYFEDSEEIFGVTERAARDPETGKTVYVDDMTYPEWKKVYVDKTLTLEEWESSYSGNLRMPVEQTKKITRKGINNAYSVDRMVVNSKDFHDNFEKLTDRKILNERLYQESMEMLEHRDGTDCEDLAALDSLTGKIVAINRESKKSGATGFTFEQYDAIMKNENNVVLLHNHPNSSRPSFTDIKTLFENDKVSASVVACHDGSVHILSEPKRNVDIVSLYRDMVADNIEEYGHREISEKVALDVLYEMGVFRYEQR